MEKQLISISEPELERAKRKKKHKCNHHHDDEHHHHHHHHEEPILEEVKDDKLDSLLISDALESTIKRVRKVYKRLIKDIKEIGPRQLNRSLRTDYKGKRIITNSEMILGLNRPQFG